MSSSLPPRTLTDLPLLVQEKIINYCSYAELSRVRCLSKHFHQLCSEQLNRGYYQLETIIHDLQKQIKTKLPRRESERHKVRKRVNRTNQGSSCPLASSLVQIRHCLFVGLAYSMAQTDLWFIHSKLTLLFLSGSSKCAPWSPAGSHRPPFLLATRWNPFSSEAFTISTNLSDCTCFAARNTRYVFHGDRTFPRADRTQTATNPYHFSGHYST